MRNCLHNNFGEAPITAPEVHMRQIKCVNEIATEAALNVTRVSAQSENLARIGWNDVTDDDARGNLVFDTFDRTQRIDDGNR